MRVLLLCDDHYHSGQVPIEGVVPLKEQGFTFDIITDAADFKIEMLKNYPVVILSKSDQRSAQDKTSWKTEAIQDAFIEYVENGGGLVVTHNGTVAGENTDKINNLIGCRFISHPSQCPVTVKPMKPHPVTKGVESFIETDEHYKLNILTNDIDILFVSHSPSQGDADKYETDSYNNYESWIDTSGYVRTQGKGRVCVLTPGHLLPVWLNPNYQRLLKNAINWCAGDC